MSKTNSNSKTLENAISRSNVYQDHEDIPGKLVTGVTSEDPKSPASYFENLKH